MKEMNNKKNYMSPMVEILNARVEKGFAGSNGDPNAPLPGDSGLPPYIPTNQTLGVSAESFD